MWRRRRPISAPRSRARRWTSWPRNTTPWTSSPCSWPGMPRPPPAGRGCRTTWSPKRFACIKTFGGFGSVDPLKGDRAVEEVDRIAEVGLKGVKLHPSLQAFAPNEERHWPLYEKCQDLGLIVLFHTGTSGIGAGQPGGLGIRIDFARPIWLDAPAATFPDLKIVAAHFGYPWHLELLAMALHKTNISIDISGSAPRYIPPEVIRDMKGRLQDQFVFGSDYPFIQPQRCLDELKTLDIPEPVLQKVLVDNGKRLLGIA